jgi:hypothetical protein
MPDLQRLIETRLARHLRRAPAVVATEVYEYLARSTAGAAAGRNNPERFWSLLPRWLLEDARFAAGPGGAARLNDILWAQYCLVLFVRIHDDLFDQQAAPGAILFVADQLLLESETTLAKHAPDHAFWRIFRATVSTTLAGILKADALQRQPGAMNAKALRLHAEVSSIFKVGAAAICVGAGRMREFRHISRCADELAIAEQLLDDLFDIEEDVARGRYTFVANQLCTGRDGAIDLHSGPGHQVPFGDGIAAVLHRATQHVTRARRAIDRVGLAPAMRYLDAFKRRLEQLRPAIHRARVAHVFRDIIATGGRGMVPSASKRAPSAGNRHVAS